MKRQQHILLSMAQVFTLILCSTLLALSDNDQPARPVTAVVLFHGQSLNLDKKDEEILLSIANTIKSWPDCGVRLEGHVSFTEKMPTLKAMQLSDDRTKVVSDFFRNNCQITNVIVSAGYGASCPTASYDSPLHGGENNRVAVYLSVPVHPDPR